MNSHRGKNTRYLYHIVQSSRKQVTEQVLGLHLVEVPSLLTALNNTIDEILSLYRQGYGPPHKWKTSVGNRLTIIHEEKSSAIWRHVPSQSHPDDLISKGIEPSTLPHHGERDQQVITGTSSWPTTEVTTTTDNLEIKCTCCISTKFRSYNTILSKLKQLVSSCTLQKIHHQLQTSKSYRQPTTLTTQDLDQALTCCVKMVQQDFSSTRNEKIDGTTRGCSHHFSQNTAFIHRIGRSSHGEDNDNSLHFLIMQCNR